MFEHPSALADPACRNLFLLDVDGVLNACPIWDPNGPETECPWPGGWDTFRAGRYQIKFAPDLCHELIRIHKSGLAEVCWLTTWGHEANTQLAERFGFPHLEVLGSPPPLGTSEGWWKHPLAVSAAASVERVVWADDDLATSRHAFVWAESEANVLPLVPNHYIGLTPTDVAAATEFLTGRRRSLSSPDAA